MVSGIRVQDTSNVLPCLRRTHHPWALLAKNSKQSSASQSPYTTASYGGLLSTTAKPSSYITLPKTLNIKKCKIYKDNYSFN